jgi:hypothetical protein
MIDSFYVGAYWSSRKETLEEVAGKTTRTLKKLGELDSQFSTWYQLGLSRRKALEEKISLDSENIKTLYQKNSKQGEIDNLGYTSHFFSTGFWTGHKDEEASSISFNVGGEFKTDKLSNSCVIKIPYEGDSRERLLKFETAQSLIDIFVDAWQPDYAVLTSHELNNRLNIVNEFGWITYRRSIRNIPKFSNKVIYEKHLDGYLVYLANDSNYLDYSLANELLPLKDVIK